MLLLLLILVAVLIGLVVYVLKKDQQRRHIAMAEQEQTLPPVSLQTTDPVQSNIVELPIAESITAQQDELNKNEPNCDELSCDELSWKERCKIFRDKKQFQQALAAAQEAWPQWQSYEQTAITLRSMIKALESSEQEKMGALLHSLYRKASEASFLYDRAEGQTTPRWQTIAQTTDRLELEKLSFAWQSLGYKELKLLTATDIKNMVKLWGEPDHHLSARSLADTYQH
ncbi:MAG: hypothetical protein Q8L06_00300 [Pseudohongiella sp.]|nr:hypothetical protein [Pseudohongiella sp.]